MALNDLLKRFARGGSNTRGRSRRSNRPRGEGIGLVPVVKRLFGRK
jgi:hypothetical protein